MDQLFTQLPHEIRINMILNWAREFAINAEEHLSNHGLVELFKSITILDFSHYLTINKKLHRYNNHLNYHIDGDEDEDDDDDDCEFCAQDIDVDKGDGDDEEASELQSLPFAHFGHLIHLPFSSALAHLNLSKTPIGYLSSQCVNTLSHPIFQHLVTLDLSDTDIKNIDPLLNASHQQLKHQQQQRQQQPPPQHPQTQTPSFLNHYHHHHYYLHSNLKSWSLRITLTTSPIMTTSPSLPFLVLHTSPNSRNYISTHPVLPVNSFTNSSTQKIVCWRI